MPGSSSFSIFPSQNRSEQKPRTSCYNPLTMRDAKQILDDQFLEMRWRCLSLAADLDRIHRAAGGAELLKTDARLQMLRAAIESLQKSDSRRAEQVQLLFSDKSPPPSNPKSAIRNPQ